MHICRLRWPIQILLRACLYPRKWGIIIEYKMPLIVPFVIRLIMFDHMKLLQNNDSTMLTIYKMQTQQAAVSSKPVATIDQCNDSNIDG